MPVPEPPPVTAIATSGRTFRYSSAQACARLTMVSDPLFWIVLLPPLPPSSLLPHAARARANIISVGPTVQFSEVHRLAASSHLAGPPTAVAAESLRVLICSTRCRRVIRASLRHAL